MKKWILGAGILTCISLGLSAQQQNKRPHQISLEEQAQRRVNGMSEELKLTEEQKKQVGELVLENLKRQVEHHTKKREELEAEKEYRLAQEKKIASLLTEEQKLIWEEVKENRRQGRGRPGMGKPAPRRRPGFQRE